MKDLLYGHYLVKESKAPDGFLLDTGVYSVFIETDGMTYSVENKAGVGFINEAMKGSLKIVKTSSDGKVEGFSFRIIGANGYKDKDSGFIFKSRYNTVLSPHCVNRAIDRIIKACNAKEEEDAKAEGREPELLNGLRFEYRQFQLFLSYPESQLDLKRHSYMLQTEHVRVQNHLSFFPTILYRFLQLLRAYAVPKKVLNFIAFN